MTRIGSAIGSVGAFGPETRAVLSRDDGTIELVTPDGQRREVLFSGRRLRSPSRTRTLFMPADGLHFHSLSADAEWASFTQPIPRPFPQIGSARAGAVHLPSGRLQCACERDCQWLAIR